MQYNITPKKPQTAPLILTSSSLPSSEDLVLSVPPSSTSFSGYAALSSSATLLQTAIQAATPPAKHTAPIITQLLPLIPHLHFPDSKSSSEQISGQLFGHLRLHCLTHFFDLDLLISMLAQKQAQLVLQASSESGA